MSPGPGFNIQGPGLIKRWSLDFRKKSYIEEKYYYEVNPYATF